MRFLIPALLLLGLVSFAQAHDQWADGTKVPSWVKKECCGDGDAHMDPRTVRTADGYKVDDQIYPFPSSKVLPSQDGHTWAFYNPEYGISAVVYCLFMPTLGGLEWRAA